MQISPNGKHGLVVAMQDQGISNWYEANDLLSNASDHDADGKEFSDWRLPTKRELDLMHLVFTTGNGPFLNANFYWSSPGSDSFSAWRQYFASGSQNYGNKDNTFLVRAVRAF
jgi:hypothetical protein